MKRKEFDGLRHICFAAIIALIAGGCNNPGELGLNLLPSSDLIGVYSVADTNITSYTVVDDTIRTDKTTSSLFGSIVDPVFGRTNIDLACQYLLTAYPGFTPDAVPDSIFLYLYYKYFYGDTLTPQHIKVYELDQPLYDTLKYYENTDLASMANSKLLADYQFIPKWTTQYDSVQLVTDTLYHVLKIPLDISLAQKLISADSTEMSDKDSFLDYFKGLYIKADDVADKGSIVKLQMTATTDVNGSAILMHYHQTNADSVGVIDTLTIPYVVSDVCARVSGYKHNYSTSPIANLINNQQQPASRVYIQSTGGLKSLINIPDMDSWKDSVNTAINKAELILQVDTAATDLINFPPPGRLLLTFTDDNGVEYVPRDYSFSPAYYGGILNTDDYTYRFNIAQHLQDLIAGKFSNKYFYLSTFNKKGEYKRVILLGGGVPNGIRLSIAYSKISQ